jgi:hypothetical protein
MTALARASSNFKRQTDPLVREGAPCQETRNCLIVIKIWSWAPDGCLTPRQTGRLTVGRNTIMTLTIITCSKIISGILIVAQLFKELSTFSRTPRFTRIRHRTLC